MLRSTFLLKCILFCCTFYNSIAQIDNTTNIGFEKGDMRGWTMTEGLTRRNGGVTTFVNERQSSNQDYFKLFRANDGNDEKINQSPITKTYKNSGFSLRIGNIVEGGTFQKLKTSFVVSPDQAFFQYHFAILLQNSSGHNSAEKPGFKINITRANGSVVTCGDFSVQLESNLVNGFSKQGDIEYKNWTTGTMDLRLYVGQRLNVEILVQGCGGRRHFGYAYFDAEFLKNEKIEILRTSACPAPDGSMIFLAPEGFEKYAWDNGDRTRGATYKPSVNQEIKLNLTPFSSLNAACAFTIKYKIPHKSVTNNKVENICEGQHISIDNTPFNVTGNYSRTISRFGICDSTININLKVTDLPKHNFGTSFCEGQHLKIGDTTITTSGIYRVKINRPGFCDSIVTASVNVESFEIKSPLSEITITEDDNIKLVIDITKGILGLSSWKWTQDSCINCVGQTLTPAKSDIFFFKAKSASGICERTTSFKLKVVPCSVYLPNIFTPNSDNENDYFKIFGGTCIDKVNLFEIYNRWGNLLFNKINFSVNDFNANWDGQYLNTIKKVPSGAYFYRIKATTKKGAQIFKNGTFHLSY